ncbi:hypothetical protein [Phyllobacterium sp. K27]
MFIKSLAVATLIGLSGIVLSGCVADDGGTGYYGGSGGYISSYPDNGYYGRDRYDRRDRYSRESRRDRHWRDRPRRERPDRDDRPSRPNWSDNNNPRPRPPVVERPDRSDRPSKPERPRLTKERSLSSDAQKSIREQQGVGGTKRILPRMPGTSDQN